MCRIPWTCAGVLPIFPNPCVEQNISGCVIAQSLLFLLLFSAWEKNTHQLRQKHLSDLSRCCTHHLWQQSFAFLAAGGFFSSVGRRVCESRNSERRSRLPFALRSSPWTPPRGWGFSSNSAGGQILAKSDPKSTAGVQPLLLHWVRTSHTKDLAQTEEPSALQAQIL